MQETQVRFLGREDPLEKEMAPHSSILAGRIPRREEPDGATVHGVAKESNTTERVNHHHQIPIIALCIFSLLSN